MDNADLCVSVCRESGWLGELLLVALVAARALWSERRRREVVRDRDHVRAVRDSLATERDQLRAQVRELSLRPPPGGPQPVHFVGLADLGELAEIGRSLRAPAFPRPPPVPSGTTPSQGRPSTKSEDGDT